jgi:hypothetical protein
MGFSAGVTWEVRTTGSDNNGGGFKTGGAGTDYSQQDSAQFTGTDLAATSATGSSPVVTSASHNFVTADVGNIIHITAGTNWTAGFYEIKSVSLNAATLDRACASVASPTGGTWNEGGALATPGQAFGAKNSAAQIGLSNDIWIKSGTYLITSTTKNIAGGRCEDSYNSNSPDGGAETNIARYTGYQTTRGDGGTKPIIRASGISSTTLWYMNGQHTLTENIEFDGNSVSAIIGCDTADFYNGYRNVLVRNCSSYGMVLDDTGCFAINCRVTGCSGTAAFRLQRQVGEKNFCIDCVADGNTCTGFYASAAGQLFIRCLSINNTGGSSYGFDFEALGCRAINCVAYGNGADGFAAYFNNTIVAHCINCIAENNGGYGFGSDSGTHDEWYLTNCAGYNNTSGNVRSSVSTGTGFVAGSGSFFTNAGGLDFSLNNTAGAGASLRNAGFPSTWPGLSTTSYDDIGAARHQDPAGGGGSFVGGTRMVYPPTMPT